MRNDRKGFFSIDAFFALVLLVTVSGALLSAAEYRERAAIQISSMQEANMTMEKLAATINTVYANGSDFELRIDLPSQVGSCNYTVRVDNDQWRVIVDNIYTPDGVGTFTDILQAPIACKHIENVTLTPENLSNTIRVYWLNDQMRVENT